MTAAGTQHELARYRLPEGTRAVVAQRIDGRVAISDVPVYTTVEPPYARPNASVIVPSAVRNPPPSS